MFYCPAMEVPVIDKLAHRDLGTRNQWLVPIQLRWFLEIYNQFEFTGTTRIYRQNVTWFMSDKIIEKLPEMNTLVFVCQIA